MFFSENRVGRIAQVLVHYSLEVQPGQLVAVMAGVEAIPLVREVYREILRVGAYPELQLEMDEADEIYLKEASNEQLSFVSPLKQLINERFDRLLYIGADTNTRRLSRVDPKRSAQIRKVYEATMTIWAQRAARGDMRWCYTQYPTNAYAQNANMSLADYWEFMSNACLLSDPDPLASWQALSERHQELIKWLRGRKQVHILGEDTDLTLSIDGRTFLTCDGHINFPDGEIYTGPVEDSAQGSIRFALPSSYDGHPVDDIRLRFECGKVVDAHATVGEGFLLS